MNRNFRAFEAFCRQRMAMLGAFSAWVKTRPIPEEIDQEILATTEVMLGLEAFVASEVHELESHKEGVL
jgi:hypothetical protein